MALKSGNKPIGVTIVKDAVRTLEDNTRYLLAQELMVGIPDANIGRDDGPASNAVIGWTLEVGEPAHNLPPRPFLVPTVNAKVQDGTVQRGFLAAGRAALAGNLAECDAALNRTGIRVSQAVKATLNAGDFAPLSPARLAERIAKLSPKLQRQYGKLSGAARASFVSTNITILVDTGAMRNAVTWVLRKRNGRA